MVYILLEWSVNMNKNKGNIKIKSSFKKLKVLRIKLSVMSCHYCNLILILWSCCIIFLNNITMPFQNDYFMQHRYFVSFILRQNGLINYKYTTKSEQCTYLYFLTHESSICWCNKNVVFILIFLYHLFCKIKKFLNDYHFII